ncbi:MAG: cyclic nucleotide-binding domain-containing protein [Acidobacteriota bacterium]
MRRVLFILSELEDDHVSWLTEAGHSERVSSGKVLVEEGRDTASLFIVIEGKLAVTVGGGGTTRQVASLRAGEIVGELSYLDSRPPNATVTAAEDSHVFVIPRDRLARKLASDDAFAARFYRALGVFLADRLRTAVSRIGDASGGSLSDQVGADEEIDPDLLDGLDLAGARFDGFLRSLAEK